MDFNNDSPLQSLLWLQIVFPILPKLKSKDCISTLDYKAHWTDQKLQKSNVISTLLYTGLKLIFCLFKVLFFNIMKKFCLYSVCIYATNSNVSLEMKSHWQKLYFYTILWLFEMNLFMYWHQAHQPCGQLMVIKHNLIGLSTSLTNWQLYKSMLSISIPHMLKYLKFSTMNKCTMISSYHMADLLGTTASGPGNSTKK